MDKSIVWAFSVRFIKFCKPVRRYTIIHINNFLFKNIFSSIPTASAKFRRKRGAGARRKIKRKVSFSLDIAEEIGYSYRRTKRTGGSTDVYRHL